MVCVTMISIIIIIQARFSMSFSLGGVGLPYCGVYGRIPSLCPLDACRTSRIFPDTATYPGGGGSNTKFPLFESHCFKPARMTIWGL